jgi:hypothetical protein
MFFRLLKSAIFIRFSKILTYLRCSVVCLNLRYLSGPQKSRLTRLMFCRLLKSAILIWPSMSLIYLQCSVVFSNLQYLSNSQKLLTFLTCSVVFSSPRYWSGPLKTHNGPPCAVFLFLRISSSYIFSLSLSQNPAMQNAMQRGICRVLSKNIIKHSHVLCLLSLKMTQLRFNVSGCPKIAFDSCMNSTTVSRLLLKNVTSATSCFLSALSQRYPYKI